METEGAILRGVFASSVAWSWARLESETKRKDELAIVKEDPKRFFFYCFVFLGLVPFCMLLYR